jgi:hypothetical protein
MVACRENEIMTNFREAGWRPAVFEKHNPNYLKTTKAGIYSAFYPTFVVNA